jgi:cytochrome c biogenesis protein CcmG, thiol:disulfide interchange protein DsbE
MKNIFNLRYLPITIFVFLCGLFLLSLFIEDPQKIPSVMTGKPLPEFSLPGLFDGEGLTTDDFKTGETVLLNIWASWCGPCRDEHDELMLLQSMGVKIMGLNYKDDTDSARRFLGTLGNPFARIGADRQGSVAIDLGVYGVPETFIINGTGNVLYKHTGPLTQSVIDEEILPRLGKIVEE